MNRDPLDFEQRLQRLQPSALRPELRDRLQNIASPEQPPRTWLATLRIVAPLAAAAALVLAAVWLRPVPGNVAAPVVATAPEPVGTPTDCLLGARELGIYHDAEGRPYRIVQGIGISQETWRDPSNGSLQTRATPQQKLLLVSMASL